MKKFNKNILVFVICMLFVGVGLCSGDLLKGIGEACDDFLNGKASKFTRIEKLEKKIDGLSTEKICYHDNMMDVNSIKENVLGTRVVFKDGDTIVKFDSGSIGVSEDKIPEVQVKQIASSVLKLKDVSEKNGADFLYCAVPTKQMYEVYPSNVESYARDNYELFLSTLKNMGIPTLDFANIMDSNGITDPDIFYRTDHHWKVGSGFAATKAICEELNRRYDFYYNSEYTDINNYNKKIYPDWLLGFRGRQVGRLFSWYGADDFELITPCFETNMTEEQPIKNEVRKGRFEDSVLFMDNIEENYQKKDYYNWDPYSIYSGGSFRLQIMKNNLINNGKKILIIRDSFAMVVTPFLALHTSELHICDVRNNEDYVGEKFNMKEYINEIKPDYVLVLYNGVLNSQNRYNFF